MDKTQTNTADQQQKSVFWNVYKGKLSKSKKYLCITLINDKREFQTITIKLSNNLDTKKPVAFTSKKKPNYAYLQVCIEEVEKKKSDDVLSDLPFDAE